MINHHFANVDGGSEFHAFKGAAAGEGDVHLAGGEDLVGEVEDDAVEGLALGFVDGHRPGKAEGELLEAADDVVGQTAVRVIGFEDLPKVWLEKVLLPA